MFDAIGTLENWVEKGQAPDQMLAGAHGLESKTGGLATAAQVTEGATRTRPLCAYPKQAKYRGTGSIDDARNFTCVGS